MSIKEAAALKILSVANNVNSVEWSVPGSYTWVVPTNVQ